MHKIMFLCNFISRVEWSAILFYTVEGSIKDPANMKLTVQDLLPMDKGSSAFTEYEFDDRFSDFIMEDEKHMSYKVGHIHSHHNMQVYFSGTDTQELVDNVGAHNFYLSLIVNNRNEMVAKVAFEGVTNTVIRNVPLFAQDESGNRYKVGTTEMKQQSKKVFAYDCNISKAIVGDDISVPIGFMKKVAALEEPRQKPTGQRATTFYGGKSWQRPQSNYGAYNPQKSFQKKSVADDSRYDGFGFVDNDEFDFAGTFGEYQKEMEAGMQDDEHDHEIEMLVLMTFISAFGMEDSSDINSFDELIMSVDTEQMNTNEIVKSVLESYNAMYVANFPDRRRSDFKDDTLDAADYLEVYEGQFPWMEKVVDALRSLPTQTKLITK